MRASQWMMSAVSERLRYLLPVSRLHPRSVHWQRWNLASAGTTLVLLSATKSARKLVNI